MTRESLDRAAREEQAAEELADELDALSRPLAERVLGRAIELDHESREEAEAAAATIDYDTLRDIALEVGITEASLKRALLEEVDTDKDHGARPVERLTIPDTVRGGVVVGGSAGDIDARLRSAAQRRGFTETERDADRTVWSHRGGANAETWTVQQRTGDRRLVAVDVQTGAARARAWRWVIGLLVIGLLFGRFVGPLIGLALFGVAVAAVVSWVRRIGRRVRSGINQVLGSLVDAIDGEDGFDPESWLDVWERSRRK